MSAVRSWAGTHAKGNCEPGQAGSCSHKQGLLCSGSASFSHLPRAPFPADLNKTLLIRFLFDTFPRLGQYIVFMSAKRKATSEDQPASADYTVLARRYRPQQFAE